MANSITGVNDDIISMAILEAFTAEITPLNAFTTNFSSDAAKKGDRISILRTIAADAALDKTTHAAYTKQDADSDAVEVVLGQPKYVSWGLDDTEVANSSVVNMEVYGKQKGFQLAKAVLQNIWSTLTVANFSAATVVGLANAFTTEVVADVAGVCTSADMPKDMRSLIVDDGHLTNLKKDTNLADASAYGDSRTIREGAVGRLYGFDVFETTLITGIAGTVANLVGIAAHPSGLAVAMRYLAPQPGNTYLRAEPLVGEGGITLGLRDWYSNDTGVRNRVVECVFGKNVGLPAGIELLVTA